MSPEELMHLAHNELVEIEPKVNIPALPLISKTYSSSTPLEITRVPFYVALVLKKADMCKIRLPSYLYIEHLNSLYEQEIEKPGEYSYIHPHFFSLSMELLNNCYDVENVEESKILVEKIKEIRFKKTFEGIKNISGEVLNLNNITIYEFNEIKSFLLKSMLAGQEMSNKIHGNQ